LIEVGQFVAYLLGAELFEKFGLVGIHQATAWAMVEWMVARS
jgi:hypothetical protein